MTKTLKEIRREQQEARLDRDRQARNEIRLRKKGLDERCPERSPLTSERCKLPKGHGPTHKAADGLPWHMEGRTMQHEGDCICPACRRG